MSLAAGTRRQGGPPPNYTGHVDALDYLRLGAAASVVAFHYLYAGIVSGNISSLSLSRGAGLAKYGYLGVNLFFLISGYVISTSAVGKSARQFAEGRFRRLYPAYWAALGVSSVVIALGGGAAGLHVGGLQISTNLTMVASLFHQPFVDGVYWTLVVELEFYAMVLAVLLVGWGRRLDSLLPLWGLGMFAIFLGHPATGNRPLLGGYFFYFCAGACCSIALRRGWSTLRVAAFACSAVACVQRAAILPLGWPCQLELAPG